MASVKKKLVTYLNGNERIIVPVGHDHAGEVARLVAKPARTFEGIQCDVVYESNNAEGSLDFNYIDEVEIVR